MSIDADLQGPDLTEADLGPITSAADLRRRYAAGWRDFSGANLEDANLEDANLEDANLEDANLRAANLEDANLRAANLEDANLRAANLRAANLEGANLPTGETFEVFCTEVVPALIAAGGHPVPDEAWQCHTWENCLIAASFGVHSLDAVPALYRPRCEQTIQLFDAGLITKELCYPEQV